MERVVSAQSNCCKLDIDTLSFAVNVPATVAVVKGQVMRELTESQLESVVGGFLDGDDGPTTVVVPGTRQNTRQRLRPGFSQNWITVECNGDCLGALRDLFGQQLEIGQQALEWVCDNEGNVVIGATVAGQLLGGTVGGAVGGVAGRVGGTVVGGVAGAPAGPGGAAVGAVVIGGAGQIAGQRAGSWVL
jgi:hypothetical protein